MAVNDVVTYHGGVDTPAIVLEQRDTNGDVVADGATNDPSGVTEADLLVLDGHYTRYTAAKGTARGEFEF